MDIAYKEMKGLMKYKYKYTVAFFEVYENIQNILAFDNFCTF
jgi:hypothetical protein